MRYLHVLIYEISTTHQLLHRAMAKTLKLLFYSLQVVQILGIIGGGLLIQFIPTNSSDTVISLTYGIGGVVIGISGLVLIYELLMIILSFIEKVHHPARLVVVCTISYGSL